VPRPIVIFFQPIYHYLFAFLSALVFNYPSREIFVIAITGTNGKTTVAELVNAILEEAGFKTALLSTLRFKMDAMSTANLLKMTMPGRFFLQRFIREAVKNKCDYVILEMTSEGVKQFRHKYIELDALIFTNLSPEHIESHGSYEKYRAAKFEIARSLEASIKVKKYIIANNDDKEGGHFLSVNVSNKYPYSLEDTGSVTVLEKGSISIMYQGVEIHLSLPGEFNIYNFLAAATFATSQNIKTSIIKQAIEKFEEVPGRLEEIREGQRYRVFVDYAHTPDALEKVYRIFQDRKICVLGATGGGRDKWKRKEFGRIAEEYCEKIILTNEDPYDEDPEQIVSDIRSGFSKSDIKNLPAHRSIRAGGKSEIIMDRRTAIRKAFELAHPGDIVLITGKGTDPFIMGPRGTKISWSDKDVAIKELRNINKINSP